MSKMSERDETVGRVLLRVPTFVKRHIEAVWESKALSYIRPFIEPFIPGWNFITIHYCYFIFTPLLFSIILWGSAKPFRSLSFTDALFLAISAMTEAGLNTVNLSELNTFQQACLFLLIMIGSAIPVSAVVVFFRLSSFEKAFKSEIEERRRERRARKRGSDLEAEAYGGSQELSRKHSLSKRTDFLQKVDEQDEHEDDEDLAKSPNEKTTALTEDTTDPSSSSRDGSNDVELKDPTNTAPVKDVVSPKDSGEQCRETPQESREPQNQTSAQDRRGLQALRSVRVQTTGFADNNQAHKNDKDNATPTGTIYSPSDDPWPRRRNRTVSTSSTVRGAFIAFAGVGALAAPAVPHAASRPSQNFRRTDTWLPDSKGYVLRNSQFKGLSLQEREKLGGLEYTAIAFLAVLVPVYFVLWQLLGTLALGAWVKVNRPDVTESNGLDAFWVGAFNAVSAFNNSGMSLLDANMTAFSTSIFMLLSMGLFILAGNTAFPIFLRGIVWVFWRLLPSTDYWRSEKDALRFLLDHPRRCYTNMFPSRETWYLTGTIVILNAIDWAAYPVLNIGNSKITDTSDGFEAIDGLFQALAVRSGGFYVVPIPNLRAALQVLYAIMMYISVYPVTVTMRNSNVYEERSLGIDAQDDSDDEAELEPPKVSHEGGKMGLTRRLTGAIAAKARTQKRSKKSIFVRQQIRAQLSHDIWVVVLAVFVIMIIEASQFEAHPTWFSIFNVIFEVVSAYACVGMSLGVPYNAFSFCGSFHVLSKLVLCFVMLRGRHRGLPVAIDQAVQLPGSRRLIDEDGLTLLERRSTKGSAKSMGASTKGD